MMDETINGSHALAKLVGRDTYIAAGGRIEHDLFADRAEEIWLDTGLVETLAQRRMEQAAASVTGYGNVIPVLAVLSPSTTIVWSFRGPPFACL